jgi:hypothetical protein
MLVSPPYTWQDQGLGMLNDAYVQPLNGKAGLWT